MMSHDRIARATTRQYAPHLLFLLVGHLSSTSHAAHAVSCSSPGEISDPAAASSLAAACPTVTGNLVISPSATGSISLEGIASLQGDLTLSVQDESSASSSANGVTAIASSTLRQLSGSLTIAGAGSLTNISLPALQGVDGSARLLGLPSLEALDLGAFEGGAAADFALAVVPRLLIFDLVARHGRSVGVAGNGSLVLRLDAASSSSTTTSGSTPIRELDISGVAEVQFGAAIIQGAHAIADDLAVHDSQIQQLPVLFEGLTSLEIRNNSELTELLFPGDADVQSNVVGNLRNITVMGNEKLNLTTIRQVDGAAANMTNTLSWVWPSENMDNVVLEGIIHNAFFQPLLDAHGYTSLQTSNESKPRILQNFEVTSWESTFLCEPLNEMRRRGVFPGNYSCNGESVDIPSVAQRIRVGVVPSLIVGIIAGLSIF